MKNQKKVSVAVLGATGLVGREMLHVLQDRQFPYANVYAFASSESHGEEMPFGEEMLKVEELTEKSLREKNPEVVLLATSAELSARYAPLVKEWGGIAIDNSSHFRLHPEVPLVVPEVNPEEIKRSESTRIIANPNCSTIQLVVALKPLHEKAKLTRVVVSSYQSVSGAGAAALDELQEQIGALFSQREVRAKVFPHQIAFNCIPHIDVFEADGFTKEERKIIFETRKIMNLPDLRITATSVRVPTLVSHSESVNVEFEEALSTEQAREALSEAGVVVLDEPKQNLYPLGFEVTGNDQVFVGRIRKDPSVERGLHLWVVADNLRKGAATNAIQIAELCLEKEMI